jgi:hypothetical protein
VRAELVRALESYPDGPRAGECDAPREDSKPLPLRDDEPIAEVKSEVKRNRQRARAKIAAEQRRE